MRRDLADLSNVSILHQEWDDFAEGEKITVKLQKVELTEIGRNITFIYTFYKVRRYDDGSIRSESDVGQAGAGQIEGSGPRVQSGKGAGEQGAGEGGGTLHGDGQGAEGRYAVYSRAY